MSTPISAATVKALRDRTDMPMMDCKAALTEAGGDIEKAVMILRLKGNKFLGGDKGKRETAEGRIATFVDLDKKVAAILEVRCESPSVIKNDHFIALGKDLAEQVALTNPATVDELLAQPFHKETGRTVQERIADVVGVIRENMRPARFARIEGLAGDYVHHDGSVGVLLQVTGAKADPQLLRDICMHITAVVPTPTATRIEDVPAEIVAKETELAKAQAAASGKPANIAEMIATGKLKTWYGENVLVEQKFVKDDSKIVGQLLKAAGLEAVKFLRYKVGEVSAS